MTNTARAFNRRQGQFAPVLLARLALVCALVSSLVGAAAAQQAPKQEPPKASPPRSFDYWQPDWMVRELWGPGQMPKGMMVRLLRHTTYMNYGVPKAYEGAVSTLPPTAANLSAGQKLYAAQCQSCHGRDGMGDGQPGNALSPSPALLAYMIRRPIAVDEYLLWAIGDGGAQFQSDMPAFKDKLARDDMFRIIAYMRAGFPADPAKP